MEVLQIISLGSMPLYDKHYIGIKETQVIKDPFKSGTIHPVVKRLGIDQSEGYLDYFQEAITYSDDFGEEQGYITQAAKKRVNLISKKEYEELKELEDEKRKREYLTETTIKDIDSFSNFLESNIQRAREEYKSYLLKLGYIEEDRWDYDEDTAFFMIHPLFIKEWRKHPYNDYPSWAVKEIGYFPE
jgi:hypothetical protein